DVLAVGEQLDLARSLQGGERLDHGGQFHPVVRGGGRTPVQLFAVRSAGQDDTPTAGTVRVPLAGSHCACPDDHGSRRYGTWWAASERGRYSPRSGVRGGPQVLSFSP